MFIAVFGMAKSAEAVTVETLTTSGSGSWQAPAGVTSVQVEAWGGGGSASSTGGGGGGAYAKKNSYSVTPGNNYSYYVGGAAVASYWIDSSTVYAVGGNSSASNIGGAGGSAASSIGDVTASGDPGGNESVDDHCNDIFGGSGGYGATASGGMGGAGVSLDFESCSFWAGGDDGSQPGGGGGGRNGGSAGAPGEIVLTYSISLPPAEFISIINPDNASGTDYTSLSVWESGDQTDLTSSATQVFSGTKTSSIADDATVYLCRSGAYQTHYGTVVHANAAGTQILIESITGSASEQANDKWYTNSTCNSSNYFTLSGSLAVGSSAISVASVRSSNGTADTTAVTVDGWTTSSTNFIKIWTDPSLGNRHNGKWNAAKYVLTSTSASCLTVTEAFTQVVGLQVYINWNSNNATGIDFGISGDPIISYNIVKSNPTFHNDTQYGIKAATDSGTAYIYNNLVYDIGLDDGGSRGITFANTYGNHSRVFNNTVVNTATGLFGTNDNDAVVKNNLIKSTNTAISPSSGLYGPGSGYNATDNTSLSYSVNGGATADRVSQTFTFVDEANDDFHLASNDTGAKDFGVNDPGSGLFSNDIDGSSRNASINTWDIGADEAATPIYRSVGPGVNAVLANGATNHLNISGSTATFDSALPDNIGVGDALEYDDDNNGTIDASDSIAFITARTSSTVYTIKKVDGTTPTIPSAADEIHWNINRAYTSLYDAERGAESSAIDSDLRNFDTWTDGKNILTSNEQWNIAAYANGTTADTSAVDIYGWTTGSQNYIKVYTPVSTSEVGTSQRHQGKWDTSKYQIVTSYAHDIYIYESYVKIEGLQIYRNTASTGTGAISILASSSQIGIEVSDNILKGITTLNNYWGGVYATGASVTGTLKIFNNIIYDWAGGVYNAGVLLENPFDASVYIYNNTMQACQEGIYIHGASASVIAKNNIVKGSGNTSAYIGTFASGTDYNATDGTDDIGQGTHNKISQTLTFIDEANDDFHLANTDRAARDAGTDLSADANLPFSTDIDGESRPLGQGWDIGADEAAYVPEYRMDGNIKLKGHFNFQ